MKHTKIIAIHTMKGGLGKTTVSLILASYLRYVLKKRVIVYDADTGQFSSGDTREDELFRYRSMVKMMSEPNRIPDFEVQLKKLQENAMHRASLQRYMANQAASITETDFYPIVNVSEGELAQKVFIDGEYDYIFIDLGGRSNPDIMAILGKCTHIVVPFSTQQLDLKVSLNHLIGLLNAQRSRALASDVGIFCFWNRYRNNFIKTEAV